MASRSPAKAAAPREDAGSTSGSDSLDAITFAYECGRAMRPWSFTVSYFPMLLTALTIGTVPELADPIFTHESVPAAATEQPRLRFLIRFTVLLVAGLSVHAGANLTNTFYDFKEKLDTAAHADDRTLVEERLSPNVVLLLSAACYLISGVAWAYLLQAGTWQLVQLVAAGTFLAWAYTAKPFQLKHRALGEPIVFACFGPLLAVTSAMTLATDTVACPEGGTQCIKMSALYIPATLVTFSSGLLSCAVLHANNARDIEADRASECTTLAQLLGPAGCRRLFFVLLYTPYLFIMTLPFVADLLSPWLATQGVHLPNLGTGGVWGWRPSVFVLATLPVASDLTRVYNRGELMELPQQTALFHALFSGALSLSFLPPSALARVLLSLLFAMGGGNNFYAWRASVKMVHNRLCLVLPFEPPLPLTMVALAFTSVWQIVAALVFMSGYNDELVRASAQMMLLFLVPVTFTVHNFWNLTAHGLTPAATKPISESAQREAGCVKPAADSAVVPTFECSADSEFIHFFKNVCIMGGLCSYIIRT